jgi:hypothetical protein
MKKIFAGITAIALTAGLSLAAIAGPAVASTPTPTPKATATATSTPAPKASPSVAPKATPSVAPKTTPSATPTAATTQKAAAPVAPKVTATPTPSAAPKVATTPKVTATPTPTAAPAATTNTLSLQANVTTVTPAVVLKYVTVVWSMPTWKGGAATYPQTLISQTPEQGITISVPLPTTCGGIYQIDSYVNSPALQTLLKTKTLNGPTDGAQDGSFLSPGGSGVAYTTTDQAACIPKVCIPDSAVSYTYSADKSNSGIITVKDVPNSTGILCNPFYVTATSWKYTTNSTWPQTVDVVDHLGKISTPNTYKYAAAVTCGQGDIYASTDPKAPSLTPETPGYLTAPGKPIAEHFLSDMGFTALTHTPTYWNDSASCWTPKVVTGAAHTDTLSCKAGSANAVTADAVLGGIWTVSNGSFTRSFPMGQPVLGFVPTDFTNLNYTVSLKDGSTTDGYSVTAYSLPWKVQDPSTLDCTTHVTPVTPTAVPITNCQVDGSITVTGTVGVIYTVNGKDYTKTTTIGGLTGAVTVTARSADPTLYKLTTSSWPTFQLGQPISCVVTSATGDCTPDSQGNSTAPVTLTFDNTKSKKSSTFQVNGVSYDVPAGMKQSEQVGNITSAGGSLSVLVNSSTTIVVPIAPFNGCVLVTPADPTSTPLTCAGPTAVGGSITVTLNPDLIYTISGVPTDPTQTFTTVSPVTGPVTGLAAGTYQVSVVAASGFMLDPSVKTKWPFTIPLAAVDCLQVTPVVSWVAPTCTPDSTTSSQINATDTEVQGTITIPNDPKFTFTINNGHTTTGIKPGTYHELDGTYTVVGTLTAAAVAAGDTVLPSTSVDYPYTLDSTNTVATWSTIVFTGFCLPTLPVWHDGATSTDAVCTAKGPVGTITVTHLASEVDSVTGVPEVSYTVSNDQTHQVTNLGTSISTINVAPGHYTVTAAVKPGDGVVGSQLVFPLTIAAASALCGGGGGGGDTSLAFTGGTIAWFGFVLAGGMLFLGFAFLLIRRRNRSAE